MSAKKTNIPWTTQESDFLQECFIIGTPIAVINKILSNRTSASINQKINNEGLQDIKELHYYTGSDALLPKYKERYLKNKPLERCETSEKIIWTPAGVQFMLRAYLVGIPYDRIAEELGVHWKTVVQKLKPYRKYRDRFRKRHAAMMHRHFVEKGRSYWDE